MRSGRRGTQANHSSNAVAAVAAAVTCLIIMSAASIINQHLIKSSISNYGLRQPAINSGSALEGVIKDPSTKEVSKSVADSLKRPILSPNT